jgi:hypothetical protein
MAFPSIHEVSPNVERDVSTAALTGLGVGNSHAVNKVIHWVAAMTLDPNKFNLPARAHQINERFPQITICNRLALRVFPTPLQPTFPPSIVKTLHHIVAI